jgi:two-component system response regulator AtoC
MGRRVLVIDDDEALCQLLARMLADLKCDVEYETSPLRAVERVAQAKPDLILLDIRMPQMSGLQVLQAIQATGGRVPVVMITGHADLKTAKRAMRAGAYDYVTKPFDIDVLRSILTDYAS